MSEWHLDVSGAPYHVTAQRSPNGKIAVRANGRIVAPPQPPDKVDCRFQVGTAQFHLSGAEGALQLNPVIFVDAPLPPPPPRTGLHREVLDPLQLRAVVFIVVGVILFLLASCNAMALRDRLTSAQMAEVKNEPAVLNAVQIAGSIRFGLMLEAAVAVAFVFGAAMLAARHPMAPMILEVACWAVVGVAAYTFVVLDMLAHNQVAVNPDVGKIWIARFHYTAAGMLITIGLGAGILSSFLDRQLLSLFVEE